MGEAKGGSLPGQKFKKNPRNGYEPDALAGVAGKNTTTEASWVLVVSQDRNQKRWSETDTEKESLLVHKEASPEGGENFQTMQIYGSCIIDTYT